MKPLRPPYQTQWSEIYTNKCITYLGAKLLTAVARPPLYTFRLRKIQMCYKQQQQKTALKKTLSCLRICGVYSELYSECTLRLNFYALAPFRRIYIHLCARSVYQIINILSFYAKLIRGFAFCCSCEYCILINYVLWSLAICDIEKYKLVSIRCVL